MQSTTLSLWSLLDGRAAGDLVTLTGSGTEPTTPSDFDSLLSKTNATAGRPQDIPSTYKLKKKKGKKNNVTSTQSQLLSTTGTD